MEIEDIILFKNCKVELSEDKKSYYPCCTFGNIKIICFSRIPKSEYENIENNICSIIEHETLHIVIADNIDENISKCWDNIFPTDKGFVWFKYGIVEWDNNNKKFSFLGEDII